MDKHVLWIEDDYSEIRNLVRPLEREGFKITAAMSAVEGFRKARNWQAYDLIIVDLIMPLTDALEPVPAEVAAWDAEPHAGLGLVKWLAQDLQAQCPILILSVVRDPISTFDLDNLQLAGVLLKRGLKPSIVKQEVFRILGIE